ncbi:hypothetical protein Glove_142g47 [Diversispora epigaea]|uniref:K Homology domain-containing protein n=1 Tax=Diversispora epigaea TaxID=1348612 RepID=A0A397J0Z7_9GLOM|nr:hypothetical protein Glove_142g47 [Diversispora epigaea]
MSSQNSQNKTRKRKWDLDPEGKEAPRTPHKWDEQGKESSAPTAKSIKVDATSDTSESSAPSPTPFNPDAVDPNIAAAVAAAKINAMLAAKGIQVPAKPVVVPSKTDSSENGSAEESKLVKSTTKESDLEFVQDIVINDCKNRYTLTKGATQQLIQKETGADVTTRGKYYPDKQLATEKDPPLYLHVTASTKEALDAAIKKIEELMEQSFTPAPPVPTPRPPGIHPGRQFVQDKVFVGIEPDRTFNARAKIVGPQGAYVKHIQQETGAKVQLKGRGSGYVEPTSGVEAFEPLHIHITCWSQEGLDRAKKLCEDLISTVKAEWDRHKAQQAAFPTYARSPYPRPPAYGPPPPSLPGNYPPPPANPPLPTGPPPPLGTATQSSSPSLPPTSSPSSSSTSQPPLPSYPPPPPPQTTTSTSSPPNTSNPYNNSGTTYGTNPTSSYVTSNTQNSANYSNPYNPYNQSRYYQQYPQYNYYAQQTTPQPVTQASDANYYYGYTGYAPSVTYPTTSYQTAATPAPPAPPAPPSQLAPVPTPTTTSSSSPTSTYEDKKQIITSGTSGSSGSYHAVPPPESYDNER